MLSNLRLLLLTDELISCLKECVSDLRIEESWRHDEIKTINISATYSGRKISAWGSSKNEAIALSKSVMELIERIHITQEPTHWINRKNKIKIDHTEALKRFPVLNQFMNTSSGVAAHLNKKRAELTSIAEIVERHSITKAILINQSPKYIHNEIKVWNEFDGYFVALYEFKVPGYGYLYSSAASTNLKMALKKVKEEISPLKCWSKHKENIEELIRSKDTEGPLEIQRYHLNRNFDLPFLNIVKKSTPSPFPDEDIWIAQIAPIKQFAKIRSLVITRAFCPVFQPLFFGSIQANKINPLAIKHESLNQKVDFNVIA